MSDNLRPAPAQTPTRTSPAQPKTASPPTASGPAQTRTAPPPMAPTQTTTAPPPVAPSRAQAMPPHPSSATPENLTIVPRLASGAAPIDVDWEAAIIGTNKSYGCVATVRSREPLTVTVVQALYRRSFEGNGVVRVGAIPVAPAGTEGTLTARTASGISVTYAWRWEPKSQAGSSGVAAPKQGLLSRLFGGGAAAKSAAKTRVAKRAATVAQRLGERAHLACRTKFFGLEAEGQRFAFIVDKSGSMEGQRWTACVTQLQQTLWTLSDTAQFTVVFFNEAALPDTPTWHNVNADTLTTAIDLVKWHVPGGGTVPAVAFDAVFKMAEPPDVVFFLTDGELGEFTIEHLASLKGNLPTIVNTIALENQTASEGLTDIAAESGGHYTFIPNAADAATE